MYNLQFQANFKHTVYITDTPLPEGAEYIGRKFGKWR